MPPLRQIREAQGLGLRELARIIEVDPGYLSRIERGKVRPSLKVLVRLARELKLTQFEKMLAPYVEDGS